MSDNPFMLDVNSDELSDNWNLFMITAITCVKNFGKSSMSHGDIMCIFQVMWHEAIKLKKEQLEKESITIDQLRKSRCE